MLFSVISNASLPTWVTLNIATGPYRARPRSSWSVGGSWNLSNPGCLRISFVRTSSSLIINDLASVANV